MIHQDLERGGNLDMLGKGTFVCRMKSPHRNPKKMKMMVG